MTKRVLDVGNCVPDHQAIRHLLTRKFQAEVVQTHGLDDTLAELRQGAIDLVLVNRKLDRDYSDGLEIIRAIKCDQNFASTPCMLITNYAEYQQIAIAAGAEPGFGKDRLHTPETMTILEPFLKRAQDATT
jgi:CheY-like chemotaxis protein